jgi:hypothetical protein
MKKLVQPIGCRFLNSQNKKPTSISEVCNPIERRKGDLESVSISHVVVDVYKNLTVECQIF